MVKLYSHRDIEIATRPAAAARIYPLAKTQGAPRRGTKMVLPLAILASLRETGSLGFKGSYFVRSDLFARSQDSEKSQGRDNSQFLAGDGLAPAPCPPGRSCKTNPISAGRVVGTSRLYKTKPIWPGRREAGVPEGEMCKTNPIGEKFQV